MNLRDVLFLAAIILVLAALYQTMFVCDSISAIEGYSEPSGSVVDAQQAIARREKNQKLYRMCNHMFGGDMKFVTTCQSTVDGFITYETGIKRAFEIYQQNKRDGIEWGSNIYLGILKGDADRIICQAVYRNSPEMQSLCFGSAQHKRREMWVDYWKARRKNSQDWRLSPAILQL